MPNPKPIRLDPVYQGASFNLASMINKVVGVTLTPIVQADLSAIALAVYDSTNTATAVYTEDLTIADVIFDTAQPWDKDSDGYNFLHVIDPDALPAGGKTYHFEYTFTPETGHPILETFVVPTIGRASASS